LSAKNPFLIYASLRYYITSSFYNNSFVGTPFSLEEHLS